MLFKVTYICGIDGVEDERCVFFVDAENREQALAMQERIRQMIKYNERGDLIAIDFNDERILGGNNVSHTS